MWRDGARLDGVTLLCHALGTSVPFCARPACWGRLPGPAHTRAAGPRRGCWPGSSRACVCTRRRCRITWCRRRVRGPACMESGLADAQAVGGLQRAAARTSSGRVDARIAPGSGMLGAALRGCSTCQGGTSCCVAWQFRLHIMLPGWFPRLAVIWRGTPADSPVKDQAACGSCEWVAPAARCAQPLPQGAHPGWCGAVRGRPPPARASSVRV